MNGVVYAVIGRYHPTEVLYEEDMFATEECKPKPREQYCLYLPCTEEFAFWVSAYTLRLQKYLLHAELQWDIIVL